MINANRQTSSSAVKNIVTGTLVGSAAYTLLTVAAVANLYANETPAKNDRHAIVMALLGPLNMAATYAAPIIGGIMGGVVTSVYECCRSGKKPAVNQQPLRNTN